MIVFDEVQHISEHRGTGGAYKAADVFKVLMNAARAARCAGLPHAMEIMDANPQVAGRPVASATCSHLLDLDRSGHDLLKTINDNYLSMNRQRWLMTTLRYGSHFTVTASRGACLLTHTTVDHAIETMRLCQH
jgi:hypothetical protein